MAVITGTSDNDTLDGGDEADIIRGLLGNDVIHGGGGDDRLEGDDGFDQLDGGAGSDLLFGGAGDDYLTDFAGGDDRLYGEDGHDDIVVRRFDDQAASAVLLDGGDGYDHLDFSDSAYRHDATLIGGDGNDTVSVLRGRNIVIDAGAGADRVSLNFLGANVTITFGAGADFLALNSYDGAPPAGGSITITDFQTGAQGDRLELLSYLMSRIPAWDPNGNPFGAGHYMKLVQDGADTLVQIDADGDGAASAFSTLIRLQNVAATALNIYNLGGYSGDGAAPVFSTTITGTAGLDLMFGTASWDHMEGLDSQDEMYGGAGNDYLDGGAGQDIMDGQYGSDILHGGADRDNLIDEMGGNDQLYGDEGSDFLIVNRRGDSAQSSVVIDGGAGNDYIAFSALGRYDVATLFGGDGNDDIYQVGGNAVTIVAGAGDDQVYIDYSNGVTLVTLGAGEDELHVTANGAYTHVGQDLGLYLTDFTTGKFAVGRDILYLHDYLERILTGWDGLANPFATGHLELVQSGPDTWLQMDVDGAAGPAQSRTLVTFLNVAAGSLNGTNLDGLSPFTFNILGNNTDEVLNGSGTANRIDGLGGNDQLFGNGGNDSLYGGDGADALDGGDGGDLLDGGEGADRLAGGAGNDRLVGGAGADWQSGGGGADTFVFAALTDSREHALRSDGRKFAPDVLTDFTSGEDKIDLSAIDADTGVAGNDAFTFLGTGAFTNHAGEVRYEVRGGQAHIYADVDGNGIADMQIIAAAPSLLAADFVL